MGSWVEAALDHRLAPWLLALVLAGLAEWRLGRHPATRPAADRWWLGIGLWAIGSLALAAWPTSLPAASGALAALPDVAQAGLVFVLADGLHYGVHRLMHAVPWLWRIHRVHHADADYDIATALRFHPLEWLLSAAPVLVVAVWLGPTAQAMAWAFGAVVVWNVVQHMGLARIRPLECRLGPWLLTPALHREHHARTASGGTGNYGLLLAFWDRLFDTWQPPVEGTVVGVHDWRHGDDLLANLLSPVASDQAAGMTGEAPPR